MDVSHLLDIINAQGEIHPGWNDEYLWRSWVVDKVNSFIKDHDDPVYMEIEGKNEFFADSAVRELLFDEVLFVNCRELKNGETTLVLYMNCSDVFAWGCSDAECVTTVELESLYNYHVENKKWGSTKWVCIKRNEQPQLPIVRDMKAEGYWSEDLNQLPPNQYDQVMMDRLKTVSKFNESGSD